MKVKLLDKYEATIAKLFPWPEKRKINVWLEFDEAVGSCLSFAVSIEARDYTEDDFFVTVREEAEASLTNIIKKDIENQEASRKREESRKDLNKLVADLGDKLGIEYGLADR